MNRQMAAQIPKQSSTPSVSGVLQRKCDKCRKKERIFQRSAIGPAPETVPPIAHGVLGSPGQPQDAAKRAFMEPRFAYHFSHVPVHSKSPTSIQAKLTVNTPGDIYEQEANRIADQVIATPAYTAISGAPLRIQRFVGQASRQKNAAPASVDRVLASSGRPLEPTLRQDMAQRFGHDFSRVMVHSGGAAEQSAREVNANAYTVGHNIVFGEGQFAPGTRKGRRLIAHELTHVVQQTGSDGIRDGKLGLSPTATVYLARQDKEAEAAAPRNVCGPDVTHQTIQALDLTRSQFKGWSNDERENHCNTLVSIWTGGTAWDIDELHNHEWLTRYQPECATGGAPNSCFPSVWIRNACYYPGSVNYVLFGTMCRLCFDHYVAKGHSLGDVDDFTEKSMLTLIQTYKGTKIPFLRSVAANFRDSQRWAKAGYYGWPTGGSTPPADRSQCEQCKLDYFEGRKPGRLKVSPEGKYKKIGTGEFSVHWASGRAKTFRKNLSGKSEGWFGGPTWKPNPKDYDF